MRVQLYEPDCERAAWHSPCTISVLDEEITEEQYEQILAMFGRRLEE